VLLFVVVSEFDAPTMEINPIVTKYFTVVERFKEDT
jgi:hypothetical protein